MSVYVPYGGPGVTAAACWPAAGSITCGCAWGSALDGARLPALDGPRLPARVGVRLTALLAPHPARLSARIKAPARLNVSRGRRKATPGGLRCLGAEPSSGAESAIQAQLAAYQKLAGAMAGKTTEIECSTLGLVHSNLIGFVGVAGLVTIAPAADFALVSRRALGAGARAAVITASGVCSGVLVWGGLSALGVAAIVTASADAYAVLRLAGAAYLVVLGIRALLNARRLASENGTPSASSASRAGSGGFGQGLVTNLLNPKVGIFYAAVLPQFVSHRDSVLLVSLLFAFLHALMGMIWYTFSALVLCRGRRLFTRPRARAALELSTAAVLIGLGVRVATERS